ncbi:MAG: HU family DNA-binding protein [Planctomycetes bacterium]|nr:HU family DNA-binding protein [Planctomycetota bacterium]MCB9917225.1 HU family DNA-binding protein [Planctomycetota bacterium]
MNRANDNKSDNMDDARDRRADSVRFGDLDDDDSTGLAGNQANKGMLTDAVADKLGGSRRQAARILDAVLDSITDLLNHKGRVAVKGFGTFERKIRKGRAYKHPVTGKSIEVADKLTILFKPSKNLIDATTNGSDDSSGGKDSSDEPAALFRA